MMKYLASRLLAARLNLLSARPRLLYRRGLRCSSSTPSPDEKTTIDFVKKAISAARAGKSKLPVEIYEIEGMSARGGRQLLNHLCSRRATRYLEIGVWQGSTWVASLYGNERSVEEAVAIDNWSMFGGPQEKFLANCSAYLPGSRYRLCNEDAFQIDPQRLFAEKVNLYFYDGDHSVLAQERAFTHYDSILADPFIAIVDDWKWDRVRRGTFNAFEKLGYEVVYEQALTGRKREWHHGMYVALIRKRLV